LIRGKGRQTSKLRHGAWGFEACWMRQVQNFIHKGIEGQGAGQEQNTGMERGQKRNRI